MDKSEAMTKFVASREILLKAIEDLNETIIILSPVEGIWTIKDLLGHIASWERAFLDPLKAYVKGGPFQPEAIPDHLVWNAKQAQRWPAMTLAEIRAEFDEVRQEILDTLPQLNDAQWEPKLPAPWGGAETIPEMLSGLAWHESDEHLKAIRAWQAKR